MGEHSDWGNIFYCFHRCWLQQVAMKLYIFTIYCFFKEWMRDCCEVLTVRSWRWGRDGCKNQISANKRGRGFKFWSFLVLWLCNNWISPIEYPLSPIIGLNSYNTENAIQCVSMSNQECRLKPAIANIILSLQRYCQKMQW